MMELTSRDAKSGIWGDAKREDDAPLVIQVIKQGTQTATHYGMLGFGLNYNGIDNTHYSR